MQRQREQAARLQKEKAAIQMQLMRRDDQLREFEASHVARMLEEVGALRLARDKALLDVSRLAGDVQQLQSQLKNEAAVRTQLAGRVESNAAHVTTVHGSLRAVMLEAAGREQQLERTIMRLQAELQRANEERTAVEATASATEQAAVGSTVRAMQLAEAHLGRLLQGLLVLLELARDRPKDPLDSVAHTVVSAVETATQALHFVRAEMGIAGVPPASPSYAALPVATVNAAQAAEPEPEPAPQLAPSSTPMLFTVRQQQQQPHQSQHQQPPTRYADAGAGAGAGPSSQSAALFPIVGTNGLHAAIAPRSAASVMSSSLLKQQQQQQRSSTVDRSTAAAAGVTPIRAADLFAEAAAAKRF